MFDENSEPLPDGLLSTALGGLSREAYEAMFSLDDVTLEEGGESILASQGDLGQLLFSASAGLAGFSKALTALRQITDSFTRPLGRGTELAALKEELVQLGKSRDEIDIRANEYARLVEQRDNATVMYQTLLGDRARIDTSIEKMERQQSAIPLLRELFETRMLVAPIAAIPDAPQTWQAEIRDLERQLTVLSTQISLRAKRIADLEMQLGSIVIDTTALQLDVQVTVLGPLSARHLTADIDIPKLESQLRETDRDIQGILHALGQKDHASPKELILTPATVTLLRQLMEKRSGLDAAMLAAKKESVAAQEQLEMLVASNGNAAYTARADISRLSTQLAIARSHDHDQRVLAAETIVQRQSYELQSSLKNLFPWVGNATQLEATDVPSSDQLMRWKNELKTLESVAQLAASEQEKAERELARIEAEYGVLKQSLGSASDISAEQTRADRDASWDQHRAQLSHETAVIFESAMRKDDQAWATRLTRSADLAKVTALESSRAVVSVDLQRASLTLTETEKKIATVQNAIKKFWQSISPDSKIAATPEMIENWSTKREVALKASHSLGLQKIELDSFRNDRDLTKAQLAKVLAEHGVETTDQDLSALIHEAQTLIDGFAVQKAESEKRADAERNVTSRQNALLKVEEELVNWQTEWDGIGHQCWLGSGNTIAIVREWLAQLDKLRPALDEQSNRMDRVEKMRADQAAFSEKIKTLAKQLDITAADIDPVIVWQTIQDRTSKAKKIAEKKDQTSKEMETERRLLEELQNQSTALEAEKSRYCNHFSVETLDQALQKLDALNRRNGLLAQNEKLERQLINLVDVNTIDAVERLIAELDSHALALELSKLKSEKADFDLRIQELYAAKVKAEDRVDAVGGDDEVARIEEKRRTILLTIEDRAINYVKLRSGILAAEQALRAYREEHRSAMMQRASEAFKMVSRGAYSGLSAQPDKETEILIAIAADGSSKIAKDMSKGTRFQLYLALRMAGYHEFATTRGSVPFIADDIMETFDDFRAEETFRLFADMANVGQVIYFTHHRHLCDIAKSVAPNVKIHNL